ncbi:carbohydrate-binding module family 50 protein [Whalleya microplaca]|nr:carbohydrate-binding module family 50 protein [Whalleya microplaca]
MDPHYGNQGYQDGRQYGEAASYYNGQPNSQYPSAGGPNGQQGYGQPNNTQYGNAYNSPAGVPGAPGGQYNDRQQSHSPYQSEGPYSQSVPQNAGPGQDGERGLMGGLAGAAAGAYGGHKMGHGVIGALGGALAGHKLQDFVHDRKEKKEEEKLQQQMHSTPPPPSYSPGPNYPPQHHSDGYGHGHHHSGHHSPSRDRSIGHYGGNFSSSSHDIHLEGDYDLRATCRRQSGGSQVSILNLNRVLSNEDGHFRWVSGGSGSGSVTVQSGDTLREIARRHNCNFEELARANNINNPDMIYPGQNLHLPGRSVGNFSSSARDIRLVDGGRVLEAELRNTRGDWHRSRIDLDERIGNSDGELRLV